MQTKGSMGRKRSTSETFNVGEMDLVIEKKAGIPRRSFLRATGAVVGGVGAMLALGGCAEAIHASADGEGNSINCAIRNCSMEEMLDKFNIKQLVEYERYCRDRQLWDQMKELFAEDSNVIVSWYQGDAAGFIDGSKAMGVVIPHKIHSVIVWLNGGRAVAEMICSIIARSSIEDKLYDLIAYSRLNYHVQKFDDEWKIVRFEGVYENDSLVPVGPDDVAALDFDVERTSYEYLLKTNALIGRTVSAELPGDDRPETVEALMKLSEDWLQESAQ